MGVCHLHKMAIIRTPLSDSDDVISHDSTTTELLKKGTCIVTAKLSLDLLCFRAGISQNDFLAQTVEFYTKISHISPSPLSKCFSLLVFYCVKVFCEWSTFNTFSLSFVCTLVVGWEGLKIINILCEVFCYQAVCKLVTELI